MELVVKSFFVEMTGFKFAPWDPEFWLEETFFFFMTYNRCKPEGKGYSLLFFIGLRHF